MANPFVHIELNSNDVGKARPFYAGLFAWELEDMDMGPMGAYTTIGVGDDGTGGGMMQHPMPGAPSYGFRTWALTIWRHRPKARSLGGTVIRDVTPIPGMGSFSLIQDPTGAVFGLWESANAS